MNKSLMAAIVREMTTQPTEPKEWFALMLRTAIELRESFAEEFGTGCPTIRAFDKIIKELTTTM